MVIYNSSNPCPKCGCKEAKTRWDSILDSMDRTCSWCAYRWSEEPLDSVTPQVCDCRRERMAKLEAVVDAARRLIEAEEANTETEARLWVELEEALKDATND